MADDPIKRILIAIGALLISMSVGVVIGAWICSTPPEPVGKWQPAKQDKRIAGAGTETVKPTDCAVVVAKPAAKQQLDLPPEIRDNPQKHVSSAVIIQPGERYQSVVGIFDESTGKTDTLTQRMAYPLLATEHRGRAGFGYGYKSGAQVGHLYLGETLLQIKGWHIGGEVHLFTDGTPLIEGVLEWRW